MARRRFERGRPGRENNKRLEVRPPELDTMAEVFAVAGEKLEMVADEAIALLKLFVANPEIEKARAEFERAQKVEEKFQTDFDGVDFTMR